MRSLRDTGGLGRLLEWRRIPLANTLWPALVLFFLPWTNLSCNDRVLVHQSGLQSCYGGFSPSAQVRRMMERNQLPGQQAPERLPIAPFTIPFAGFLVLGLIGGLACVVGVAARFRAVGTGLHLLALGCGSVCFLLLVAQMIFGFPLDRQIQQNAERMQQQRQVAQNNPFGNPFGNPNAGANIAAEAMMAVDVQYSAWFWLTLVLTFLSVPLLLIETIVALIGATAKGLILAGGLAAVFIGACVISVGTSFGVTEFVLNKRDPAAQNPVVNRPGPVPQNPFLPPVVRPPAGKLVLSKQGRLMPNDPIREGRPTQSFAINMKQGKTYVIDLQSMEMDAYLYLYDPANMKVAQDDDGGGMLNSRIRFTANRTGVYTIGCSVLGAVRNGGANFTLAVHEE